MGVRLSELDNGFFSDGEFSGIVGYYRKGRVNSSYLKLSDFSSRLGFSGIGVDHEIRFPEVVRPGVSFKIEVERENVDIDKEGMRNSTNENVIFGEERENFVDLRFFVAGLELGRRDALT